MKKGILPLMLALVMCLGLAAPALALGDTAISGTELKSGSLDMDKLSREEIAALLERAPTTMPEKIFAVEPSVTAPYRAGQLTEEVLQAATDRLNAMRRLAGVPGVVWDAALSQNAQYGAVIQACHGGLNHYPTQPADMPDDFYQQAQVASSSSNLSAGRTLVGAVDGLMYDNSGSNLTSLGHRRWQLNPTLGKVGFGYATSDTLYRTYVAEKVFDKSGQGCDYNFIAWPASGDFPQNLFNANLPWSITLNPDKYSAPRASEVTVTLKRDSDGKSWTFDNKESYSTDSSGRYFNVNTVNYGVSNCIIFRPDEVTGYEGTYTVTVSGLKDSSGKAIDVFSYQVDFFDPKALPQPQAPAAPSIPQSGISYSSTQWVSVDGKAVTFHAYKLKDENGDDINFVKLRDVAYALNGTAAQFSVGYDEETDSISLRTGESYTPSGSEMIQNFRGDQPFTRGNSSLKIDGAPADLGAITLTDAEGGEYNYFKLRDLGRALGFNVGYDDDRDIFIETDKAYTDED